MLLMLLLLRKTARNVAGGMFEVVLVVGVVDGGGDVEVVSDTGVCKKTKTTLLQQPTTAETAAIIDHDKQKERSVCKHR